MVFIVHCQIMILQKKKRSVSFSFSGASWNASIWSYKLWWMFDGSHPLSHHIEFIHYILHLFCRIFSLFFFFCIFTLKHSRLAQIHWNFCTINDLRAYLFSTSTSIIATKHSQLIRTEAFWKNNEICLNDNSACDYTDVLRVNRKKNSSFLCNAALSDALFRKYSGTHRIFELIYVECAIYWHQFNRHQCQFRIFESHFSIGHSENLRFIWHDYFTWSEQELVWSSA